MAVLPRWVASLAARLTAKKFVYRLSNSDTVLRGRWVRRPDGLDELRLAPDASVSLWGTTFIGVLSRFPDGRATFLSHQTRTFLIGQFEVIE
jgi:hypothetical protein